MTYFRGFRPRFALASIGGLLLGLCLIGLSIESSYAQASTGTIEGLLMDDSGGALPGGTVVILNDQTSLKRSVTTDEKGYYRIALLPVGDYDVAAEMPGYLSTRQARLKLTVGQTLRYDIKPATGSTSEVVVTSTPAVVETSRTLFSTTVEKNAIANWPVNGRNFIDFVLLTPGVTRDPRAGDLSFGGQRGTLNSLLIDGADNNNTFFGQSMGRTGSGRAPYQFSQETVREFQVNANGYSAELGRAGGGVVNVVTKSDTNEFHGSLFEFYRDKSLNANSWSNNQLGKPKSPYHFNQFGGSLGGPAVRNAVFFFFGYEGQRNRLSQTINPGGQFTADTLPDVLRARAFPYPLSFNSDVYFFKVDWQVNERHRVLGRYNHQGFHGANLERFSPFSAFEHTGTPWSRPTPWPSH